MWAHASEDRETDRIVRTLRERLLRRLGEVWSVKTLHLTVTLCLQLSGQVS